MTWLFLLVAAGAGLFMLPGGGRSAADRRLAQIIAVCAVAAVLLSLRLTPFALGALLIGGAFFGIGWFREKMLDGGFQDLGEEASAGAAGPAPPRAGVMSREEALSVLGLAPGADVEAIHTAHRRMIAKAHPDSGGSDYLAAKVNEARDVLLR